MVGKLLADGSLLIREEGFAPLLVALRPDTSPATATVQLLDRRHDALQEAPGEVVELSLQEVHKLRALGLSQREAGLLIHSRFRVALCR